MNPTATLHMANNTRIVIELLPEIAPNTTASFIYAASHGVFDGHAIERIVPGNWVDMSYTGFRKKEGQYLIPYESKLHPEITPLDSDVGYVCMGGYGELGQAGCEFFFPLRPCPENKGLYPVFGKVISGIEEILRLEHIAIRPVTDFPIPGLEVNAPIEPEIIDHVELDLKGVTYPEPVRVNEGVLTPPWEQFWERYDG
ncbi:MAG: peptidylprolyl isomerase [Lachnospiraceae bacterium]